MAQGGDASAQNELGLLYYEGRGVVQNYGKAKEWFDKAVEQGHTGAQVNLGRCISEGKALRKVAKWHCSGLRERQDKRMLWR